jgi:hypothetical protein
MGGTRKTGFMTEQQLGYVKEKQHESFSILQEQWTQYHTSKYNKNP